MAVITVREFQERYLKARPPNVQLNPTYLMTTVGDCAYLMATQDIKMLYKNHAYEKVSFAQERGIIGYDRLQNDFYTIIDIGSKLGTPIKPNQDYWVIYTRDSSEPTRCTHLALLMANIRFIFQSQTKKLTTDKLEYPFIESALDIGDKPAYLLNLNILEPL